MRKSILSSSRIHGYFKASTPLVRCFPFRPNPQPPPSLALAARACRGTLDALEPQRHCQPLPGQLPQWVLGVQGAITLIDNDNEPLSRSGLEPVSAHRQPRRGRNFTTRKLPQFTDWPIASWTWLNLEPRSFRQRLRRETTAFQISAISRHLSPHTRRHSPAHRISRNRLPVRSTPRSRFHLAGELPCSL